MPLDQREKPRFPSPSIALTLVLTAFAGMRIIGRCWRVLFPVTVDSVNARYVEILAGQCLLFAAPAAFYLLRSRAKTSVMRIRALPMGACFCLLLAGVSSVFAIGILTAFWAFLLDMLSIPLVSTGIPIPGNANELWLALLVIGMTPALCEELLFRGLLLPSLERLGTRCALLLSGLLFALMHGQITALPAHLLLGFVLGLLLVGYGSLLAPMIFHATYNGAAMLLSYAQQSLDPGQIGETAGKTHALSVTELAANALPVLLVTGLTAGALIWLPMRLAARKNSPILHKPSGERLPLEARALLVMLLVYFLIEYGRNIYAVTSFAGVAL